MLSFHEAEKNIQELKTFSATKEAFLKETQFKSWTEAEAAIPKFAKADELQKFQVQKGKTLPKSFMVSFHYIHYVHTGLQRFDCHGNVQ